jgi:hypothetical protein
MAAMATKRVCLYYSIHFWKIFLFDLNGGGTRGSSQRQREAKIVSTQREPRIKSHGRRFLFDCRPTTFFFFICEIFVVQSATVEIPAETKRDGSPPFFGRFYPTCDARNGGRELLLWVAFCGMPSTAAQPTKKKRERIFRRMTLMTQNWKPRCPSRNM